MLANYQFNYSFSGNSNKPIILFLHGFMGNNNEFEPVVSLLSEDFYCLTIDLPGHGNTQILGSDDYYTMSNTAQGLMTLLDELNIEKCLLVGYSMGGRLALYLTLHYPQRFPKVVLESASAGLATETERLERIKQDNQIARKLARSVDKQAFLSFLWNWYQQPIFGKINQHPKFEQMIQQRLQNQPLELAKSLQFMGTGCQPCLWEKFKDNTNPLLLLVGKEDEKFIVINGQMADICSYARLEVISNAGHNIHFENTTAFVASLRQFLLG